MEVWGLSRYLLWKKMEQVIKDIGKKLDEVKDHGYLVELTRLYI